MLATMQLEARDKRALILGSIAVVLLLAYLLWPSPRVESSVELVPASQRGPSPAPVAAPPPPAPPLQTVTVTPAPAVAAPAAGGVPQGLILHGVTGSGAIFGFADGSQRYVARGREVVPGLTLQAVSLNHVILTMGSANLRLGFGGAAVPLSQAPGAAPVATTLPVPATPVGPSRPSNASPSGPSS